MKKISVLFIILLLVPTLLFSLDKVGSSGFQFLKIDIGARGSGMGNAFVPMVDDATAMYWNPAGAARVDGNEVNFTYNKWPAGISHSYLGVVNHMDFGTIGFSVVNLFTGEMDVTTEEAGGPTGEKFTAGDLAVGLTYAVNWTDKFAVGVTGKYLYEWLDTDQEISTFAFDVGTLYNTGMLNNLVIGISISNFTPSVGYEVDADGDGSSQDDFLYQPDIDEDGDGLIDEDWEDFEFEGPITFKMGAKFDIFNNLDGNDAVGVIQMEQVTDRDETMSFGVENWYNDFFAVRMGYQVGYSTNSYSFGLGYKNELIAFDYAYNDMGYLTEDFVNGVHRMSLSIKF